MEILLTFIEVAFFLSIYFMVFIDFKSNFKKYIPEIAIMAIIGMGVFFLLGKYGIWATVILVLVIAFILCRRHDKNIVSCIIEIIISSFSIIIAELISILIILFIFESDAPYYAYFASLGISMMIILPTTYVIFKKKTLDVQKVLGSHSNIVLCIINLVLFIMCMKIIMQYIGMEVSSVFQCGILIISICVINFNYFFDIYRKDKNSKKSEIKESINPLIHELIDEMKAKEHEYKNHMNTLYCMMQLCMDENIKERAIRYMGQACNNEGILSELSYVDNTILKAILLSKINQAEKREIEFTYDIYDNLNDIPLDDSELTVVISNLLNNAIEASSESINKVMEFIAECEDGKYIITVSNSVNNLKDDMVSKIDKKGVSTKGDDRGYGLYNVNKIIKKYKGKMNMNLDGDIFNITLEI